MRLFFNIGRWLNLALIGRQEDGRFPRRHRLRSRSADRLVRREVFRFEDLGFERVAEDFYNVFFREVEIGEFDVEGLRFRTARRAL
jgi:hypothetical protein